MFFPNLPTSNELFDKCGYLGVLLRDVFQLSGDINFLRTTRKAPNFLYQFEINSVTLQLTLNYRATYSFFFKAKLHFSHLLSLYCRIVLIRRQKLSLCYCYCGFLSLVIVSLSHDLISRNCHNPLPWEFGDHLVSSDQWTVHTKKVSNYSRIQYRHEHCSLNIKNFPV